VGNRFDLRHRQQGAVAIIVALCMVVLVGFAGLALDGGHLYVTKTELQNAADACALAASYELTGSPIEEGNFERAINAGSTVGTQNRVDFQGGSIVPADIDVEFASSLSGPWSSSGSGSSKYVRCTIVQDEIAPWFMQVLGFGNQTVRAFATATLAPSQSNCAIPMGLCTNGGTPPDYGYVKGQWYSMNFDESGSSVTGNFRWVDFDPSSETTGCPGGGAQELACLFEKGGECSLPPQGPLTCSGASPGNPISGCIGQTGSANSLQKAFNARFGICQGGNCTNDELRMSPPDFTGFAYNASTWQNPPPQNAYAGTYAGTLNFSSARTSDQASYRQVQEAEVPSGAKRASFDQMKQFGADRRLVTVPLVECLPDFDKGQQAPIRGYACVLLLEPYKKVGSNVIVSAEYLGRSNEPGSPCATSGAVGNSTSAGPLVPALVQ